MRRKQADRMFFSRDFHPGGVRTCRACKSVLRDGECKRAACRLSAEGVARARGAVVKSDFVHAVRERFPAHAPLPQPPTVKQQVERAYAALLTREDDAALALSLQTSREQLRHLASLYGCTVYPWDTDADVRKRVERAVLTRGKVTS